MANLVLGRLFAKSPFNDLIEHMKLVDKCMENLKTALNDCFVKGEKDCSSKFSAVSNAEYDADQIKNHIRDNLPRSLFMPVSRHLFLEVLSIQDSLPDTAEDIGVLFSMKDSITLPEELKPLFQKLIDKSFLTFDQIKKVVFGMNDFAEASFAGKESSKFLSTLKELGKLEHEVDEIQAELLRQFFKIEDRFTPGEIYLWLNIFKKISDISNSSEKLGNRIRIMFAK